MGTVLSTAAAIVVFIFAQPIISWFRPDDPVVIEYGARAIRFVAVVMPFMGVSTYVNQIYQGLGFKGRATVLASMRQGICFIPLIFILPAIFKYTGVCLAQPGADLLTFFVNLPFVILLYTRLLNHPDGEEVVKK